MMKVDGDGQGNSMAQLGITPQTKEMLKKALLNPNKHEASDLLHQFIFSIRDKSKEQSIINWLWDQTNGDNFQARLVLLEVARRCCVVLPAASYTGTNSFFFQLACSEEHWDELDTYLADREFYDDFEELLAKLFTGENLTKVKSDNVGMVMLAARFGQLEALKTLIDEQGCSLHVKDNSNHTLVYMAAFSRHLATMKWLVDERKLPLETTEHSVAKLLEFAVIGGNLEVLKWLIDVKKLLPMSRDESGRTMLHEAAELGDLAILKWLINEKGCAPDIKDNNGNTIIHIAAQCDNLHIIEWLVDEQGCSLKQKDSKGNSLVLLAARFGSRECLLWLIDDKRLGINSLSEKNNFNNTAIAEANNNGHNGLAVEISSLIKTTREQQLEQENTKLKTEKQKLKAENKALKDKIAEDQSHKKEVPTQVELKRTYSFWVGATQDESGQEKRKAEKPLPNQQSKKRSKLPVVEQRSNTDDDASMIKQQTMNNKKYNRSS